MIISDGRRSAYYSVKQTRILESPLEESVKTVDWEKAKQGFWDGLKKHLLDICQRRDKIIKSRLRIRLLCFGTKASGL